MNKINKVGRPKTHPRLLKLPAGYRIQSWIIDWLNMQPESSASLIEEAVIKQYKLEKPDVK